MKLKTDLMSPLVKSRQNRKENQNPRIVQKVNEFMQQLYFTFTIVCEREKGINTTGNPT